jgi:hypothetical protein
MVDHIRTKQSANQKDEGDFGEGERQQKKDLAGKGGLDTRY